VLLNIGGIANLTWLKAGGSIDDVVAFDTGPGNCVIDHVCRTNDPRGPGYDPEGQQARLVPASRTALEAMMSESFFEKPPPKSTDVPVMVELFESAPDMRDADFLTRASTATMFAVAAIEFAMAAHLPDKFDELIVSGGGTKNMLIMQHLRRSFSGASVRTVDELRIPSEAKEAVAFALLGAATLDGVPSNVPSVTGAKRAVVLGSITPKP
jgi:anhydro-N-acetylmuramic acid kinase